MSEPKADSQLHFIGTANGEPSCTVTPLEQGGSGRVYYRITTASGSFVLAKYNHHREENRHFVAIARFLHDVGINVPRIHFHDADEGLILMQDLGSEDLWSFRDSDWPIRRALYASALRQAARLHGHAHRLIDRHPLHLQVPFDEELYLWEQGYFFEHAASGLFGWENPLIEHAAATPALRKLASELARLPRCLIHRDFQSQNILIHQGAAWLVDFQGMRFGLPHYDLASLLYDPYVTLSEPEREELAALYLSLAAEEHVPLEGDFQWLLLACAAQRLMQALGAYGFLGLKAGRPGFLRHVPAARASLRSVLQKLDGFENLAQLLDHAPVQHTLAN